MSLGIAVLTEEGVVMATESLGTLLTTRHQQIELKCTDCGYEGSPNLTCVNCNKALGPVPIMSHQAPVSHTFHCQKLFKINQFVGVITIGHTKINHIRVQHLLYQFIGQLKNEDKDNDYCEAMVQHWRNFCTASIILTEHSGKTEFIMAGIQSEQTLLPYSAHIIIENGEIQTSSTIEFGITLAGSHDSIDKLFGDDGIKQYPVKELPLQDAVDFSEFLINTQIAVDKYICRIPQVGGELDIAIVHPFYGFRWVKQKRLQQLLDS